MLDRAEQIRHCIDILRGEGSFTEQELIIPLSPTEDKGWGYCSLAGVCSLGKDNTGESSSTSKETPFSTHSSHIHSLGSCTQHKGMKAFFPQQGGPVPWEGFEQSQYQEHSANSTASGSGAGGGMNAAWAISQPVPPRGWAVLNAAESKMKSARK